MSPVVSVVIPMLDAAGHLEVLISSLLSQKFDEPWEIIAVDNGSRDGTEMVARSCFNNDLPKNLVRCEVVLVQSPQGYATPRNAGVRSATAPLLVFCDADGAVDEHWLASITRSLEHHPLVASRKFRASDVRVRNPDGALSEQGRLLTMLGIPYAQTGGLGCTRALFDALGGFDPYFDHGGEDVDFSLRARFELGVEPFMEPTALYWTTTPASLKKAVKKGFRDGRSRVCLYQRHKGRHGEPPSGPVAGLRRLLGIVWKIVGLRRGDRMQGLALAQQVGLLFGRAAWSVKLKVRYF